MKLLDTISDKNNNQIDIYSSKLALSPAFSLILRTYAEIVEKKLAPPHINLDNTDSVIWAQRNDGTILGGICYKFGDKEDWNSAYIQLSFTADSSRGLGINALCHPYLEQDAKSSGYTRVMSMVHVNNQARLRSAEKVGLKPMFYVMYKQIK